MYCKKCGKFIGTDADLCDECKQKESARSENQYYQATNLYKNTGFYQSQTISQDTSAINLGKAITAIILSTISFSLIYMGIIAIISGYSYLAYVTIGVIFAVLGLIFGIQSIMNFKQTNYIKSGKRIPVLILGIASVINSGFSLFYFFIMFIFLKEF